jgi:hypothetical protein
MTTKALILTLAALAFAPAARAEDTATATPACDGLGLNSAFLSEYYCGQFTRIVEGGETRTISPDDPDVAETDWYQIELLRDAYRVDPKKTLELIERIRLAGGLPES